MSPWSGECGYSARHPVEWGLADAEGPKHPNDSGVTFQEKVPVSTSGDPDFPLTF